VIRRYRKLTKGCLPLYEVTNREKMMRVTTRNDSHSVDSSAIICMMDSELGTNVPAVLVLVQEASHVYPLISLGHATKPHGPEIAIGACVKIGTHWSSAILNIGVCSSVVPVA
jgi:hypothetical protein